MILDYAYTSLNLDILLMTHTYCLVVTNWALLNVVNYELKLVSKWLRLNKLSLNAGKLIFFRSEQHSLDYENILVKLYKVKPSRTSEISRYLH